MDESGQYNNEKSRVMIVMVRGPGFTRYKNIHKFTVIKMCIWKTDKWNKTLNLEMDSIQDVVYDNDSLSNQ